MKRVHSFVALLIIAAVLLLAGCAVIIVNQDGGSTIAVDVVLDKDIEVDATVRDITGAEIRRTVGP